MGFSRSREREKSSAAIEVPDFQRPSHATGLDPARLCQLAVLKAIFLVVVMERTRARGGRRVTRLLEKRMRVLCLALRDAAVGALSLVVVCVLCLCCDSQWAAFNMSF